jgi:hypothetical protein
MEEDKADPIININITSQECLEFASGKSQEKNREQLHPENSAAAQTRSNASLNYANTQPTSSPAGNPAVLLPDLANHQQTLNLESNTTQSSYTPPEHQQVDHAYEKMDAVNDDDQLPVTRTLTASTLLSDVIRPEESTTYLRNRISFYLSTRYSDTFKSAYVTTPPSQSTEVADKIIIVKFKGQDDFESLLADNHDELKINEESASPVFHSYDPAAVQQDVTSRSVTATDIPLFLKESAIRAAMAKFGTIVKFKLSTPRNSLFQKAVVTYTDATTSQLFAKKWCVWCCCQCIRAGTMIFCGDVSQILCVIKVNFVFCCDLSNYYIRKLSLVPSLRHY